MNWSKALIAGVAAGVVVWLADFVMHGMILGNTYAGMPDVFAQDATPWEFLFVELAVAIAAAILFAKTRSSWGAGLAGGATFGFFLGLVAAMSAFFNSLVIEGFPYFLNWCWAGTNLIGGVIIGAVIGLVYK